MEDQDRQMLTRLRDELADVERKLSTLSMRADFLRMTVKGLEGPDSLESAPEQLPALAVEPGEALQVTPVPNGAVDTIYAKDAVRGILRDTQHPWRIRDFPEEVERRGGLSTPSDRWRPSARPPSDYCKAASLSEWKTADTGCRRPSPPKGRWMSHDIGRPPAISTF